MNKTDIIFGDKADIFAYSGEGSYTAVFNGTDVGFFKDCKAELEKLGFERYTESSVRDNNFAVYQSNDMLANLEYHDAFKRAYVTYTPKTESRVLPELEKPQYTPCGLPTIITQVGAERFHKDAVSSCYIIRAADGSFIVYDSDFGDGFADVIYNILKKQAPDPDNIVIAAWFVSHPHLDHVGAFLDFADKYAGDKTITLKQMVYNYSDPSYVGTTVEELIEKTPIAAKKLNPDVTFVRPHAGYLLYYADLTFEVLYSQINYIAPTEGKIQDSNGASIVSQLTTDSGVKVLLGGDHCVCGSYNGLPFCEGALYNWYGDYIKSDVVTLFHHGWGGGADLEVYNYIKPSVVLWPATMFRLYHDSDGTPYTPIITHPRNQYFVNPENASKNGVKGYYIAADCIHIVDLSSKELKVTEYEHCDEYLKNTGL